MKGAGLLRIFPAQAFSRCENLNHVVLPEGLEEIRAEAFENCENLLTLQIPDSVHEINPTAFVNCRHIMLFVYPDSYAMNYAKDVGILYSEL